MVCIASSSGRHCLLCLQKRNPRKLAWTKSFRRAHGKESTYKKILGTKLSSPTFATVSKFSDASRPGSLHCPKLPPARNTLTVGLLVTVDSTLAFAARRNVPVRYNRDLVQTTLKAMGRVAEIRAKRERAFYKARMRGNKERQRADDRKLVEENQHLLPPSERFPVQKEDEDMEVDVEAVKEKVAKRRKEIEEDEMSEAEVAVPKTKNKRKLKMKVGGGTEEMDVDE